MPSLKEYNVKLARLRNTRKMTKTMKLVSVNKLRKAQEAEKRASAFTGRMQSIFSRLVASGVEERHPLTTPRAQVRRVLTLVFTSDRGLCGGFNNNLIRMVVGWTRQETERQREVQVSCCGKRGNAYLKSRVTIRTHYEDASARPKFADAHQIGADVRHAFLSGDIDELYLAYNQPQGALAQKPVIERLIPFDPGSLTQPAARLDGDWIFEPGQVELMGALLPKLVDLRIYSALLCTAAGEHGARMRAMDQATTNADNMIGLLTLQRNRARQAQITTELTEIVAGAEALK